MFDNQLLEMAHVAEQEHMQQAIMARARAQARRERRRLRPSRAARAWAAFWAPRDVAHGSRVSGADGSPADLSTCADC